MGYVYTFIVTVMFSLIGTCVTLAKAWVSSGVITFSRFFFGVLFLLGYMLLSRKKISLRFGYGAVWIGVACKCINYFAENYAVSHGYSFGNIIVWPMQCVAILFFSLFFLHEKISARAIAGVVLCIGGVALISWSGRPLGQLFADGALLYTVLFVIAGIGAAGFTMAQKLLLDRMDSCNLNLSMFAVCVLVTAAPLPFTAEAMGSFRFSALAGLVILGLITGVAFLLAAEAMKTLPVFLVTILQSMNVMLTLLWSVLFFHEPVTGYILGGAGIFLCGMVLVNLKLPAKTKENA
ncbi:MAG: DMT family transporter [Eubacteriales bacterium]